MNFIHEPYDLLSGHYYFFFRVINDLALQKENGIDVFEKSAKNSLLRPLQLGELQAILDIWEVYRYQYGESLIQHKGRQGNLNEAS